MTSPQRRSGARPIMLAAVVVLVIAGLLYGGDRLARTVAENRVATQLQSELGTDAKPTVNITGFPFLAQVMRGSVDTMHVVADNIPASDASRIGVRHIDLHLNGLSSDDRYRTVTAAKAEGTATIDYATFQTMAGFPAAFVGDGRVELTVDSKVLTVDLLAKITGRPELNVADQTITLAEPKVTVGGVDIPEFTAKALLATAVKPVPVTDVPFGLTLSSITAEAAGINAGVSGTNVVVRR